MKNRSAWGLVALAMGMLLLPAGFYRFIAYPTHLSIKEDFRRRLKQREVVVALARAGKLGAPDRSADQHFKVLPFRYRNLSAGGEVVVEKPSGSIKVFFFRKRDLLSSPRHGFLYADDDKPSIYFRREFEQVERMAPHWFWGYSR